MAKNYKDIKEAFGVLFYIVLYLFITLLYCTPRILAQCTFMDPSIIPVDFDFPITLYSYGLVAICGYYAGIDFGLPTKLKIKSNIDREVKSRNVLIVLVSLFIILVESVFLSIKFGFKLEIEDGCGSVSFNAIKLPVFEISAAFIITYYFFISGNKITLEE